MINGSAEPGFRPVERLFTRMVEGSRGGAALAVYHRGRPVIDLWGGVRDATGAPWQRDTACVAISTTKGVVATALHVLADRGVIEYDRPAAHYWPEFAQADKARITVRQILCHRAGLFDIRSRIDHADRMLDWEYMVSALAAAPARDIPDGSTAYHALTWGYLVGEIMRRASGREVPEIVRDELTRPLGLDGCFVGGADVDMDRAARLVSTPGRDPSRRQTEREHPGQPPRRRRQKIAWQVVAKVLHAFGHPMALDRMRDALAPRGISTVDFSSASVLRAVMPSVNGMFTARSLARLYAALAGGGTLDGTRILSPETLARATEVNVRGYDQIVLMPMRWRLGYHQLYTFRGAQPRAFGHFGWGGSGAWADMERGLSLGFVVNTGSGTPLGDMRITRLSSALVQCADRLR